jgi:ribosomal protein L40E
MPDKETSAFVFGIFSGVAIGLVAAGAIFLFEGGGVLLVAGLVLGFTGLFVYSFTFETGQTKGQKTRDTKTAESLSGKMDAHKYCRYCGMENKIDAVYCEKCGKQIS